MFVKNLIVRVKFIGVARQFKLYESRSRTTRRAAIDAYSRRRATVAKCAVRFGTSERFPLGVRQNRAVRVVVVVVVIIATLSTLV